MSKLPASCQPRLELEAPLLVGVVVEVPAHVLVVVARGARAGRPGPPRPRGARPARCACAGSRSSSGRPAAPARRRRSPISKGALSPVAAAQDVAARPIERAEVELPDAVAARRRPVRRSRSGRAAASARASARGWPDRAGRWTCHAPDGGLDRLDVGDGDLPPAGRVADRVHLDRRDRAPRDLGAEGARCGPRRRSSRAALGAFIPPPRCDDGFARRLGCQNR